MFDFKKLEHTADLAYTIKADTPEGLFQAAFHCWQNALLRATPRGKTSKTTFRFKESTVAILLVEFLNHFNYLLLTKGLLVINIKNIQLKKWDEFELKIKADIIKLNAPDMFITQEIKAVTYHQLSIVKKGNYYTTKLVFDV